MALLSVLDQSPVTRGETDAEAIQATLRLAAAADRLGYHRYWLAEHHSTPGLAGSAPEILVGQIAARTTRIRVGAGGVLLPHYSPLKVAESFRTLEALFPGRIDLGIGRGPGGDRSVVRALARGGAEDPVPFAERVAELLGFLSPAAGAPSEHPAGAVRAMPLVETVPEVWLLGSSRESAACAAGAGTAFSFAHFIAGDAGAEVVRSYVHDFRPSAHSSRPRASLGVFVICADTEAEARRLARSRDDFLARVLSGAAPPTPSAVPLSGWERIWHELAVQEHSRARTIVGAPEQVRDRLQAVGAAFGVDEYVVLTNTEDFPSRLRSYQLLAEVLEPLSPAACPPPVQAAARGGRA